MPSTNPLTLYEGNDETVDLAFYEDEQQSVPLMLDGRDVEFIVKTRKQQGDQDAVTVTSATGGVVITDSIGGKAQALVPGSALTPDKRFYRADAVEQATQHRKTGVYGPLTVEDL